MPTSYLILPDVVPAPRPLVTTPSDPYSTAGSTVTDQFEVAAGQETTRTFTLSSIPVTGTLVVFRNGLRLREGLHRDYTYVPYVVTLTYDLYDTDRVTLVYEAGA